MNRREAFLAESLKEWTRALAEVLGPIPPSSAKWHGLGDIARVLAPFMGSNRNHAHYPTGGGMDFQNVRTAAESKCLSFSVSDRLVDIVKPRFLTLEYFSENPRESFLLLELDELSASGIDGRATAGKEELLEYPPGHYSSRDVWERGYLRHDENGREIALPSDCRCVTRWFGGNILIVAKGSLWNGDPATYDGRHNRMTAAQIRSTIERTAAARLE